MVNSSFQNRNASLACNRSLLKQLRERRGLTQADMARLSGYSERLIVKAESGGTLSVRTIEDLADVLSTGDQIVYAEDLVSDPITLAKKFIDILHVHQKEAVAAMRHFLDEEVVFHITGDVKTIPFAGTHRGIEELDRAFKIFFTILEVPEGHDHTSHYHYVGQGTDVVVWGESWIKPRGLSMDKPMSVSNLLRFRKGKLYHYEDHFDTQLGAELLRPVLEREKEPGSDRRGGPQSDGKRNLAGE